MKPVGTFETKDALKACLKYWQRRLFLADWAVVAKLCEPTEVNNQGRIGEISDYGKIRCWA